MILNKSELLEIIDWDIIETKKLYTHRGKHSLSTDIAEDRLEKLMFMRDYVEEIEDVTDLEDDKNQSLDSLNFKD